MLFSLSLFLLFVENQTLKCPQYLFDASYLNIECHKLNETKSITWNEAEDFCASMNSNLVNTFLKNNRINVEISFETDRNQSVEKSFWIGLAKGTFTEEIWYWALLGPIPFNRKIFLMGSCRSRRI